MTNNKIIIVLIYPIYPNNKIWMNIMRKSEKLNKIKKVLLYLQHFDKYSLFFGRFFCWKYLNFLMHFSWNFIFLCKINKFFITLKFEQYFMIVWHGNFIFRWS
jgi:hypothetical protein